MSRGQRRRERGQRRASFVEGKLLGLARLNPQRFAWIIRAHLQLRVFMAIGVALVSALVLAFLLHTWLGPGPLARSLSILLIFLTLWRISASLARSISRPLTELVAVARDLGDGHMDRRMPTEGSPQSNYGAEVGLIARCINDMAERLENHTRDQRELLAGVSHELRTPLGHLRILIDSAREQHQRVEAEVAGAHRSYVEQNERLLGELEREIIDIDQLVDRLLAHSRLEFARLDVREVDLAQLAIDALERTGTDASTLDFECRQRSIVADPALLGRALANLIHNAREHGGGVHRLWVCDRRVAQPDDDAHRASLPGIAFVVEDAGPGIEEDSRERIFAQFVQGRRPAHRPRRPGSLGLGLSLVQRIAQAHGGQAFADNRSEGGASIGFVVPLSPAKAGR